VEAEDRLPLPARVIPELLRKALENGKDPPVMLKRPLMGRCAGLLDKTEAPSVVRS